MTILAHLIEKLVQFWMCRGVKGHLKQRYKDILQHFTEVLEQVLGTIDITAHNTEPDQYSMKLQH